MLILCSVFLLTSLSWTPRGEARPRTLSDLDPPPHAVAVRSLDEPADALIGLGHIRKRFFTKAFRITENPPIPTTDKEFKQLRTLILNSRSDPHSVVDELLMERRSAAKATVS